MKTKSSPPRWATRLLQWYCPQHRLEEVEGDLRAEFDFQVKQVELAKARFDYIRNVFGFIRPFALKRKKTTINNGSMFSESSLGKSREKFEVRIGNKNNNNGISIVL